MASNEWEYHSTQGLWRKVVTLKQILRWSVKQLIDNHLIWVFTQPLNYAEVCWVCISLPRLEKNPKLFYLKLFPLPVFHSLIFLSKSSLSDNIHPTHITSSPPFYKFCVSVSLSTLSIHPTALSVKFDNTDHQGSCLLWATAWKFAWRNAELFDMYLIMDSRTKNFQAYIQTTSCLQANCISLYILSWSIWIDSPSLMHIYSASWTATWRIQSDDILAQYAHNCMAKTIQIAHRWHWNTSHWNIVVFQNTDKHTIFLKATPVHMLLFLSILLSRSLKI